MACEVSKRIATSHINDRARKELAPALDFIVNLKDGYFSDEVKMYPKLFYKLVNDKAVYYTSGKEIVKDLIDGKAVKVNGKLSEVSFKTRDADRNPVADDKYSTYESLAAFIDTFEGHLYNKSYSNVPVYEVQNKQLRLDYDNLAQAIETTISKSPPSEPALSSEIAKDYSNDFKAIKEAFQRVKSVLISSSEAVRTKAYKAMVEDGLISNDTGLWLAANREMNIFKDSTIDENIRAISNYIINVLEISDLTKANLDKVITDDPKNIIGFKLVYNPLRVHKNLIETLSQGQDRDTPFGKAILNIKQVIDNAETLLEDMATEDLVKQVAKENDTIAVRENRVKIERVLKVLRERQAFAPEKRKAGIQRQIDTELAKLELLPTEESVKNQVTGKMGDVPNYWLAKFTSMSSLSDFTVQALNQLLQKVQSIKYTKLKQLEAKTDKLINDLKRTNPLAAQNLNKYFEIFFNRETTYFFDEKSYDPNVNSNDPKVKGSGIIATDTYRYLNEFDADIYEEYSLRKALKAKAGHELNLYNTPEKRKVYEEAIERYIDYKEDNFETAQYLTKEAKKILEKQVRYVNLDLETLYYTDETRQEETTTPTEFPVVGTLKRLRNKFRNEHKQYLTGTRNKALGPTVNENYKKALEKYKSLGIKIGKEGALLEIAEAMSDFRKANEGKDYDDTPDAEATARFQEAYLNRKRTDTDEQVADWLAIHSRTIFTKEYKDELYPKYKERGEIYDSLGEKDVKYSELMDELNGIIYPYRTTTQEPNGLRLKPEETRRVKEIHDILDSLENQDFFKDITPDYTNNTKEIESLRATLEGTSVVINGLRQQAFRLPSDSSKYMVPGVDKIFTQEEVEDTLSFKQVQSIQSKIKAIKMANIEIIRAELGNGVANKLVRLEELKEEINELRINSTTSYYKEAYVNAWDNTIKDLEIPEEFLYRIDGELIPVKLGETYQDGDEEITISESHFQNSDISKDMALDKFYNSNWFILNHHKVGNTFKPNRQWMYFRPSKTEHIKEVQPGIHWNKFNLQEPVKTTMDGRPMVKPQHINTNIKSKYGLSDSQETFFMGMIGLQTLQDSLPEEERGIHLESQSVLPRKPGTKAVAKRRDLKLFSATRQDLKGSIIWERFIEGLQRTVDEGADDVFGDFNNQEADFLPLYFQTSERGGINPDLQSLNLFEGVRAFSEHTLDYQIKTKEVIPFVENVKTVMSAKKNQPLAKTKKVARWFTEMFGGDPIRLQSKAGENKRLELLTEFFDKFVYGKHMEEEKFLNFKIGDTEINPTKALQRGRNAFTSLTFMGQVAGQTGNLSAGLLNLVAQGAIKKGYSNFGYKDIIAGWGEWLKQAPLYWQSIGNTEERSWFFNFYEWSRIKDGEYENSFANRIEKSGMFRKVVDRDGLFAPLRAVETTLAANLLIAFSKNYKVGDTTMWNLVQKDGNFVIPNVSQEVILDFQSKLQRLVYETSGAYNKLERPLIARTTIGAAFMMMSSWFVPTIEKHYGKQRFTATGIRRGYINEVVSWLVQMIQSGTYLEGTEDQKLAAEIVTFYIATLLTLAAILHFGFDDGEDLDEDNHLQNYVFLTLYKGKREFEATFPYFGMNEFWLKVERPFPNLVPFWNDLVKVGKAIGGPGDFFPEYDTSGSNTVKYYNKGDYKIWTETLRILGMKESKLDAYLNLEALKSLENR